MKYAATLPNTFSLIIVAGMNCAAYGKLRQRVQRDSLPVKLSQKRTSC